MAPRMNPGEYTYATLKLAGVFAAIALFDAVLAGTLPLIFPLDSMDHILYIGILRAIEIAIVAIIYRKNIVSIMGLRGWRSLSRQLVLGLLVAACGAAGFFLLDWLSVAAAGFPLKKMMFPPGSAPNCGIVTYLLVAGVVAPFAEEFFFRGVLIHTAGPARATLASKCYFDPLLILAFVLPHVGLGGNMHSAALLMQTLVWGSCAFVAIRLYDLSRGIFAGWALHGAANAVIFLVGRGLL